MAANARSEGLVLVTTTKEIITPEVLKVETLILTVVEEQEGIVTSTNYQFNVKKMWFKDHSTL